MSLLDKFKLIQQQAVEEHYSKLKDEFLEKVKKNSFQDSYYIGQNLSSQSADVFIKLFAKDGFNAKKYYNDDDNCSYIVVTCPP